MSKSHGTRQGKGQPQLTQHFSPHDKDASKADASKADASNVATGGAQPLTLDMLIGELEKLRKDVTGELTTSLNTAMAPIQASLQKIADTVASHTATISAMETALSSHSDDLSTLQHEVATLKSKVETTTQMNEKLQLAVEDLVSRSKRQNLRVIGIPEGAEGTDARLFMTTLFQDVIGDALPDTSFELDRAHRSLGPKPAQGSRPSLVRFHRYIQTGQLLGILGPLKEYRCGPLYPIHCHLQFSCFSVFLTVPGVIHSICFLFYNERLHKSEYHYLNDVLLVVLFLFH